MSESPRLIGPPPMDLVLGRLGDDTPKHQASSLRIPRTTANIVNSTDYRTNSSRACKIQNINFHHKTSLPPTLSSILLQSLKSPAAPVPPTSLSGFSLPSPWSHPWIARYSSLSHCFLLAPVGSSSPPDDLPDPISPQTHSICLGSSWKFKFLPNPVATPPVAASPPLHWSPLPLLKGSTTQSCRVLLLSKHTTTAGTRSPVDRSLCCGLLLMAAGSLLSYVDMLSHYFPFPPLLLLYSLRLLLLSIINYLSTYPSRLNSTPLLSSFLSTLFSILLQLLSLPNSSISTLLLPYCLLLVLCAPTPPLLPCLQDETDMDPTLCRHSSAPSNTSIPLKYLLDHLQVSSLHFARRSRTTQVRSMLDSLVLTKRIYRIKRIKRRCESHNKRQSKSNHIPIHTRPSSNECLRYIRIWTVPCPSWDWITTTLSTLATYLSWYYYSNRFTTYSSSISPHITNKSPCTTKSKPVLQYNTNLLRPTYSLKYIIITTQHTTVQSLHILIREYSRPQYTSISSPPSTFVIHCDKNKKPTCFTLLCFSDPPNSPQHLQRYTWYSLLVSLTNFDTTPNMSIYSSVSGSPRTNIAQPSRTGTPLYRKALITETPDEDKDLTEVIISGWVKTNASLAVGSDVVLHLTNGITGSRVTDPHARIHIVTDKIREPSRHDDDFRSKLFSSYQGLQGYLFLGLSANFKDYVLDWPISFAQFASRSAISFFCHPMPGCVAKTFATPSLEHILVLPPHLDHRLAWHVALDYFTPIAKSIGIEADDFIVTPGPPGAPDTPTKTFCFITRSSLPESLRNTVLSLGASASDFEDPRPIDTDGKAIMHNKFPRHTLKLCPGTENLSRLTQYTRSDATNFLWALIHGYNEEITLQYIQDTTGVSAYSWLQITKYGDYFAILMPTDDTPRIINNHPQVIFIDKPPVSLLWTILPFTFPNEYSLGRGRIESYIGSSPLHYVYYIPTSGDPSDLTQDDYIYFPEPLRVTLFANLMRSQAANPLRKLSQVNVPTPPPSIRSNPKALKLSYAPPTPQQTPPRIPPAPLPQATGTPSATTPSQTNTSAPSAVVTNMLQSLHQRLIALETLQIDEKLCEQSDFLFGNPSVADVWA